MESRGLLQSARHDICKMLDGSISTFEQYNSQTRLENISGQVQCSFAFSQAELIDVCSLRALIVEGSRTVVKM